MKTKLGYAIIVLVVFSLMLLGCSSSSSKSALETTIEAMPQPSPRLYLDKDTLSLSLPPGGTVSFFGKTFTQDWVFELSDQELKETMAYNLRMASAGQANVGVEILLKQGAQESLLGEDSFLIDTDQYTAYRGQITASKVATENGDQLILRLNVYGSDFGIVKGSASSIDVLMNPEVIASEVLEERTKALVWVATNIVGENNLEAPIFTDFKDQLDYVILSGDDARWSVGWGLPESEKPYFLDWINGAFNAVEITLEEFQAQDSWSRDGIIFRVNP